MSRDPRRDLGIAIGLSHARVCLLHQHSSRYPYPLKPTAYDPISAPQKLAVLVSHHTAPECGMMLARTCVPAANAA